MAGKKPNMTWDEYIRDAGSQEEMDKRIQEYSDDKLAKATREEEIRMNRPTMVEKFMDGIAKLFKKDKDNKSKSQAAAISQMRDNER